MNLGVLGMDFVKRTLYLYFSHGCPHYSNEQAACAYTLYILEDIHQCEHGRTVDIRGASWSFLMVVGCHQMRGAHSECDSSYGTTWTSTDPARHRNPLPSARCFW